MTEEERVEKWGKGIAEMDSLTMEEKKSVCRTASAQLLVLYGMTVFAAVCFLVWMLLEEPEMMEYFNHVSGTVNGNFDHHTNTQARRMGAAVTSLPTLLPLMALVLIPGVAVFLRCRKTLLRRGAKKLSGQWRMETDVKTLRGLTVDNLKQAMDLLEDDKIQYLILTPPVSIKESLFMQTAHEKGNLFTLKVSRKEGRGSRVYGLGEQTKEQVIYALQNYMGRGIIPDTGVWEEVCSFSDSPVQEPENKGDYMEIARLLSQSNESILEEVKLLEESPGDFYRIHKEQLEERFSNGMKPWVILADILVDKDIAVELDWKEELLEFVYAVNKCSAVRENKELTVRKELFSGMEDMCIEDWISVLNGSWKSSGQQLIQLDIDSDSYVLASVQEKNIPVLKELAEKVGGRILYTAPKEEDGVETFLQGLRERGEELLNHIYWTFTEDKYTSVSTFSKDMSAYMEENRENWKPEEIAVKGRNVYIIYEAFISGREELLDNEQVVDESALDEECRIDGLFQTDIQMLLTADNGSCFTNGELLMKIHNQMAGKDLGDHQFFEGLERRDTSGDIPAWYVRLSS